MEVGIEVRLPRTGLATVDAARVVDEELAAAAERATVLVQAEVMRRTPANLGLLRRAWGREVFPLGGGNALVLGRVFNSLSYALPVETGAKPHWPPFAPIALWVRRKLRVAADELASVTFLVRRKIAREGTPAAWMARDGWRATLPAVRGYFRVALRRIGGRLRGAK